MNLHKYSTSLRQKVNNLARQIIEFLKQTHTHTHEQKKQRSKRKQSGNLCRLIDISCHRGHPFLVCTIIALI